MCWELALAIVAVAVPRATERAAKEVCGLSIGETLARARSDAGLSVADVSLRTRIRDSVIERIEHDDYSASGIDLFARGEIREIARAVGVDSRPLIEEYDASRPPAGPVWGPAGPARETAERSGTAKSADAIRAVLADLPQRNRSWLLPLASPVVAASCGLLIPPGTPQPAPP